MTKMPDNLKRALLDALAQDLRPEDIERLDRERVALSDKLHAVYKEYLDAAKREGRPFDFTISVAVNALVDVMANAIAGIALTLSSVQGRKPDALAAVLVGVVQANVQEIVVDRIRLGREGERH